MKKSLSLKFLDFSLPQASDSASRPFSAPKSPSEFQALTAHFSRAPLILRGIDIGPCLKNWTLPHLLSSPEAEKKVKVHRSRDFRLDFLKKNFTYDTVSFGELVRRCSDPQEKLFWYLRSLGEDPR